jgi:hypothetical protein
LTQQAIDTTPTAETKEAKEARKRYQRESKLKRFERIQEDAMKTWRGYELADLRAVESAWPGHGKHITAKQFAQVMALHADGVGLNKACEQAGVKYSTLLRKSIASDVLASLFHRARAAYIQARVDAMEDIVERAGKEYENPKLRNVEINRARLHCDNIKWMAERVLRRVYGHYLEVNARSDVAVQFQVLGLSSGPGLTHHEPNESQTVDAEDIKEGSGHSDGLP